MINGLTESQVRHQLINTALRKGVSFGEASEKASEAINAYQDERTPDAVKQIFINMIELIFSTENHETAVQKFMVKSTPSLCALSPREKHQEIIAFSKKCRRSLKIKSIIKAISF